MGELQLIFVTVIAFFGGVINSVAGGGTFLLFPALIMSGISPFSANILCSIGLWPASISSAYTYRKAFVRMQDKLTLMLAISLSGSTIGTLILLNTPEKTFEDLIPWLLLVATLIFTFGKKFSPKETYAPIWVSRALQFVIAIYGGYFGAGIGILMLAMLQLMGMRDIHAMNAVKTILATAINLAAIALFIFSGKILWDIALWLIPAAILGGYVGASVALRVKPDYIRFAVSLVGFVMTIYFFIR